MVNWKHRGKTNFPLNSSDPSKTIITKPIPKAPANAILAAITWCSTSKTANV